MVFDFHYECCTHFDALIRQRNADDSLLRLKAVTNNVCNVASSYSGKAYGHRHLVARLSRLWP